MKRTLFFMILLVLQSNVVAQSRASGFCPEAGIEDPSGLKEFLLTLKSAVAREDQSAVASLVQFPVGFDGQGRLDKEEFTKRYKEIFTAETKQILASQNVESLYCGAAGLGVGEGEIWVNGGQNADTFQVTFFSLSKYAKAGVDSMSETAEVDDFFLQLRRAIIGNDRNAVVSMVQFPLSVYTQKGTVTFKSKEALFKRFDWVFNLLVKRKVGLLKVNDLFATDHGIGAGDGVLWIGPPLGSRKIGSRLLAVSNGE